MRLGPGTMTWILAQAWLVQVGNPFSMCLCEKVAELLSYPGTYDDIRGSSKVT